MTKYEKLLKTWCDKLIEYQISEIKDPYFYGGIMCPTCAMIHGRIGDAVYPLTLMYDKTGDNKYLTAAKAVIDWSEYNVKRADGSYFNDKCSGWKGISVFSAVSIGLALFYHGNCLDENTRTKWTNIFIRITDFIYEFFDLPTTNPNINYFVTVCDVMAFAYRLTGDEKYKQKAYEKFNFVKKFFTPAGLLFGEGHGGETPKGCKHVDIGYNVEESLPALASFGHLMEDEEVLKFTAEKFAAHIEFMLPDGAWDNSFGTRANKWTYWGSRTSDGAAAGLCYLVNYNPVFAEAIERNFRLMESCTHDGLLYGGLMYKEYGEEPCAHHTFCHAKALAVMVDTNFKYENPVSIPRDNVYGVKSFSDIHVNLISIGKLRATVTDNDALNYNGSAVTGGTLSVLWTKDTGILMAAVVADYMASLKEPRNMQLSRKSEVYENCALRISDGKFESVNDKEAVLNIKETKEKIVVDVSGTLRDIHYKPSAGYKFTYTFEENALSVTAECESDAVLSIPIISSYSDTVEQTGNKITIYKPKATVTVETENGQLLLPHGKDYRNITLVGGFMNLPIKANLRKNQPFSFKITL